MSDGTNCISKIQRWIDLVAYLSGHHYPVPLDRISEHVPAYRNLVPKDGGGADPSVRRMFERDKDELKALGLHIASEGASESSHYSLSTRDAYLPFVNLVKEAHPSVRPSHGVFELTLTPRDAAAVASGLRILATQPGSPLRAAARTALRKLSVSPPAPDSVSGEPETHDPIAQLADPETLRSASTMATLQSALAGRKTLEFQYVSMRRGSTSGRRVDPWGLVHEAGAWYLIARDHDADSPRMFRVGRITDVRLAHSKPKKRDFEVPSDFRIRDWAGRRPWEYGSSEIPLEEVRIFFRFPRARWAERNGFGTRVTEHPDGGEERSFQVRDPDALARWVLGMGGDARVLSPAHVVGRVRTLAGEVAARHERGDGVVDGGSEGGSEGGSLRPAIPAEIRTDVTARPV